MIALAYPTLACGLVEVGLRVREAVHGKGGRTRDRGTRVLIASSLGVSIGAAGVGGGGRGGGGGGGGGATIEVDPDQAVVTTGPYRWIRHPSYAGLLLIVAGLGLAIGNWLSAAACLVLPLPALAWRIHVEEAELGRVLGDAYGAYRKGTARLIPGLW